MSIFYVSIAVLLALLLAFSQRQYMQLPSPLVFNLRREIVIVLVCITLSILSTWLLNGKIAGSEPFEIGSISQEAAGINSIDKTVAGRWDLVAKDQGKLFKHLAVFIIPLILFLFKGTIKGRIHLFFVFAQGYVLTDSITGIAKGLVERYRPFAYKSLAEVEQLTGKPRVKYMEDIVSPDIRNSFFSGDASLTAYGLLFFAMAYQLFYKQSRYRATIWIFVIIFIVLECYLRALSGKHFPSDVATGALVGSIIAYLIIQLHRKTKQQELLI